MKKLTALEMAQDSSIGRNLAPEETSELQRLRRELVELNNDFLNEVSDILTGGKRELDLELMKNQRAKIFRSEK
ncbi:hypothetical protein [Duganella sp. S19_KUP01_CR8]|uniref:hypothetical protein n=1 Tax=Duganella sp. S19_KUP01_CR8 TaxID=3025502 RepID=UPI002FCDAF80